MDSVKRKRTIAQLRDCTSFFWQSPHKEPSMSDQPPFDPQDPFGVGRSLKDDDLRTPERSSRPGCSFSPVPLFSLSTLKYECGADEVPCNIETK